MRAYSIDCQLECQVMSCQLKVIAVAVITLEATAIRGDKVRIN